MSLLAIAQSKSLIDLIDPDCQPDLHGWNWQKELVKHRSVRTVGLEHVLNQAGVGFAGLFNNIPLKERAISAVPASWKKELPTKDVGWTGFKKDQLTDAHKAKPIRLDKACVAILIACIALDDASYTAPDFFDLVRVRPQIYFVEGFNYEFYLRHIQGRPIEDELIKASDQFTQNRLQNISHQYLVTKPTALKIFGFLHPNFPSEINRVVAEREPSRYHEEEYVIYNPLAYANPSGKTQDAEQKRVMPV